MLAALAAQRDRLAVITASAEGFSQRMDNLNAKIRSANEYRKRYNAVILEVKNEIAKKRLQVEGKIGIFNYSAEVLRRQLGLMLGNFTDDLQAR